MKKRNYFARVIVAILTIAMIINCGLPGWESSVKAEAAGTAKTALEITQEMGVGWNLGNSLDSHNHGSGNSSETSWGNPTVTAELIKTVKAEGFNTIRIPVTWYEHVTRTEKNGKVEYEIDNAWMNRVEEVVKYAYDEGMYVILNIHHEEGYINRSDLGDAYQPMSEYVVSLWKQIATRFASYDQHLIFEGMNEPRAVGADDEWSTEDSKKIEVINKLNEDFVKTVRNVNSDYKNTRLLMVPSYAASADSPMYSKVVIPNTGLDSNGDGKDDYVAVSIHAYKPYDYTMNKNTSHSEFTSGYDASLKSTINSICKTYVRKGIPVIIGEFGASNYGYDDARIAWAKAYMTYAKQAGIPCVLWDNNKDNNSDSSEAHGYVNRSAVNNTSNYNERWYASGKKVVDELIKVYNDPSVVWRSYAEGSLGTLRPHEQLSDSKKIAGYYGGGESYAIRGNFGNYKSGTELAIKYTDSEPSLGLMDSSWGGWTQIGPDDVDETNGIAYFSYDYVIEAWGTGKNALNYIKVVPGDANYSMYVLNVLENTPSEPETPTGITNPKMNSFSVTASGDMGLNFYMELPTNAAKIKLTGPAGDISKDLSDSDKNGEYKISYTVAAKDIGKDITVTVYTSDWQVISFGNSENISGGSYKITVSKALENIMSYSGSSSDLVALAQSMYTYGAVSAHYFGNDTSWVKIEGSQNIYSLTGSLNSTALNSYEERISGTLPSDVTYLGASLILEEDVTIRHYFTGNVWSHSFKVKGSQVSVNQVSGVSGLYYIEVKDIDAVDFDTAYTVSVDGWSCSYSVMSYAKKAHSAIDREGIKAVTAAMYDYMKKAESYFKK